MKQYYECHITLLGKPWEVSKVVEKLGWKFSVIDGDPDLGEGIKCYATRQFNMKYKTEFIIDIVDETAEEIAKAKGIKVLRRKIEIVIYDKKTINN